MARQAALTKGAERDEVQTDKAIALPKDLRTFLQKLIDHDPKEQMPI